MDLANGSHVAFTSGMCVALADRSTLPGEGGHTELQHPTLPDEGGHAEHDHDTTVHDMWYPPPPCNPVSGEGGAHLLITHTARWLVV